MLLKCSLLFLGLVVGFQSHEFCNFEKDLCKWSHLYQCHFSHETRKSLEGEKGYLFLSKNTCKKAGISFQVEQNFYKFQFRYFINGTGRCTLAVSAHYRWSGRSYIWSCNKNQGPRWNKADIFLMDEGILDVLDYVAIETYITGDVTVAIGNISPTNVGKTMQTCPTIPITNKAKLRKTTTRKPTTNAPRITTILQAASSFITNSTDPQTNHSIRLSTNGVTTPSITSSQVITTGYVSSQSFVSTPKKAAVTSQDKTRATESSIGTSHSSLVDQTSDRSNLKVTTAIPVVTVTARNHPNLTTASGRQQSTLLRDVRTLKSVSDGINVVKTDKSQEQLSYKSLEIGLIGLSVFATIFVVVVTVVSCISYRRK